MSKVDEIMSCRLEAEEILNQLEDALKEIEDLKKENAALKSLFKANNIPLPPGK